MIWLTISLWALWTGALIWFGERMFPGTAGQTLTTWLQAIGSIGAIFAAFLVGHEQSKAALRAVTKERSEKRQSIVAVAAAAAEHARRIAEILEQPDPGHARMYNVYDESIVNGMVHALTNSPAHEVGSPNGVIALLALRDQFAFLGVQMEKYLAGPWNLEEFKSALESCGDDRESRTIAIRAAEKVLEKNVCMRLEQIQRHYNELRAAVERA